MPTYLGARGDWIADVVRQRQPASVLDIGCGDGWTLARLAELKVEQVGVDMNGAALPGARAAAPHATFVEQTAAELPFENQSFDCVILADVLEHVPREVQAVVVQEAARVCKPGGLLILTVPHAGLSQVLDPLDVKRRWPRLYKAYTTSPIGKAAETPEDIGHQHLTPERLDGLLKRYFRVDQATYTGLLEGVIVVVAVVGERLGFLRGPALDWLRHAAARDGGRATPKALAYNVRIVGTRL